MGIEEESLFKKAEQCIAGGKPAQGELYLRQALKTYGQRFEETGSRDDGAAAREAALSLAELSMEQGNMHGADVYYVLADRYGKA